MLNAAILLAGGSGTRMRAASTDKVLEPLLGRPALLYSLSAFKESGQIGRVVIVHRDLSQREQILDALRTTPVLAEGLDILFASGGKERQDSVLAALEVLPPSDGLVFIHDGARPLLTPQTVQALAALALEHGAAVAARPVTDTIKQIDGETLRDIPRPTLRAMETPQVFRHHEILKAYRLVKEKGHQVSDDAAAAALLGIQPRIHIPDHPNIKLTLPHDIRLAEVLLEERKTQPASNTMDAPFRIGQGYDIHRFTTGRPCILGGVEIPHDRGLEGHSDADCLSHAIADAVLGGAGLKDIGHYFPPGEKRTKGMNSLLIVEGAVKEAAKVGLHPVNVDATLIAQEPKVGPHVPAMKEKLAAALGISVSQIAIKATTNEGIGGLGRAEGIAAHAVCLLMKGS